MAKLSQSLKVICINVIILLGAAYRTDKSLFLWGPKIDVILRARTEERRWETHPKIHDYIVIPKD